MLPRRLKNFNLYVDGRSMLGLCPAVTLPKLTRKMDEYRAGGLNAPMKIDMGHEALSLEFELAENEENLLKSWGINDMSALGLRFRAALERDGIDPVVEGLDIYVRGRLSEVDHGSHKPGEAANMKYRMELIYYKLTQNGDDILEIDLINMKEVVGGVDRLSAIREALGI